MAAGNFGQTHAIGLDQAHTALGDFLQKLPHTRIPPRRLIKNFNDGLGGGFQANAYGMKAE
jgi:hypothetical protein